MFLAYSDLTQLFSKSQGIKDDLNNILNTYVDKLNGEKNDIMNMTNFLFDEEKLLKDSFPSYDKPVLKFGQRTERRE